MSQLGRPAVYTGRVKQHILTLIRRHGLTGARRILNAASRGRASKAQKALAAKRDLVVVPNALGISMPTLGKFAVEAGIEVKMGRPSKAA